jgi:hypothetical protein
LLLNRSISWSLLTLGGPGSGTDMSRDDNCYYSNDLAERDTDTDKDTHTVDQLSNYSSDPAIHGAKSIKRDLPRRKRHTTEAKETYYSSDPDIHGAIPTHEPEEAGIVAAGVGVGEEEAAADGSEGNVHSYGELVRPGDVWWDGGVGEFGKVLYIMTVYRKYTRALTFQNFHETVAGTWGLRAECW